MSATLERPPAGDRVASRSDEALRALVVMPVATRRGGAEVTLLDAVRHTRGRAQWLVAFLEDGPMVGEVERLGGRAVVVPAGRLREPWRLAGVSRRLAALARAWRPDIVVGWMPKAHLYAGPAARVLGLPSVWFQHGLPSPRDPIDRLTALLPADGVLAPSRTVAEDQNRIRPRRPLHVAHPGVEPADAAPAPRAELLAEAGIPARAPVVGLVARLQRWKGVHVLVGAMPHVLAAHPDAHAVVVGGDHPLEPGYREHLVALATRLGVADRVHLLGFQPDARSWMRSFDVAVHASEREPWGLVVLEAMAAGRPLVAGAAGGPAEIVRDGVDGLLVPYGDEAALAERIRRLLDDPALAERLGRTAAARAADFSASGFADDVVAALWSHVAAHRPAHP